MLDCDSTTVGDCCPNGYGLTGHVATPIQTYATGHGAVGHAGQPDFVLNLTMERLLSKERKEKNEKAGI